MIHTWKGRAIGITIWKWHSFQVELWIIAPHTVVPPHSHPHIDVEFISLLGHGITVYRESPYLVSTVVSAELHWSRTFLKKLTVPWGYKHWFTVGRLPFIFLNVERWLTKPTSAAIDFKTYAN